MFHDEMLDCVQSFMLDQFLFWLEALSVIKKVGVASSMLAVLLQWIHVSFQSPCVSVHTGD
jgi:hypothetical protein